MNKLDSIVVSNTEPNSKNVLWYDNKRLLIFSNGHWSPIVDLDDIDVDNLPGVSNLQEALKSLNIKVDNKVDKVQGKTLSSNDYTDADKAKLTALPTSTQLTEKIDEAKLALFVNLWNAAWTTEGKYDPQNAPDSQHPFMGNGLWFTFAEALRIYDSWLKVGKSAMQGGYTAGNVAYRTVIPPTQSFNALDMRDCFNGNTRVEVFVTRMCVIGKMNSAFNGCTKLTTVKIHTLQFTTSVENCFAGCSSLTTVELTKLKLSISFADSPLLSLSSMQYLVDNAANTSPITITLHPDAYARLTDEIITAATAKQINFATETA